MKVGSTWLLSEAHGLRRPAVGGSGDACGSRGDARLNPGVRLGGAETPAMRRKPGTDLERTRVRLGAGGGGGRERERGGRQCR